MLLLGYRLQLQPLPDCRNWLSAEEWQYSCQVSAKRAAQFANGRALLRQLLLHYAVSDLDGSVVSLPNANAPTIYVAGLQAYMSISHSGSAVAVAYSQAGPVGVDIERCKPRNYQALAQAYPALAGVNSLPEFYQRWTKVEALSKLQQQPLLAMLQQELTAELSFFQLDLPGFALSVCSNTENPVTNTLELYN